MIEMKIWVNKVKETTKTLEYKNSGNINIDIKYISNLSSNIREAWYKLGVKQLQPIYEDLFLLSLVIFAVDKRVPRSMFPDAWTRTIQVNVPMIKSDVWNSVKDDIDKMLSYLSGDKWNVCFRACELDSNYKSQRKREAHRPDYLNSIQAVSLFSGGLDSFCGAHKLLSDNKSSLFVGFQEYGPLKGLQKELIENIHNEYPEVFISVSGFIFTLIIENGLQLFLCQSFLSSDTGLYLEQTFSEWVLRFFDNAGSLGFIHQSTNIPHVHTDCRNTSRFRPKSFAFL